VLTDETIQKIKDSLSEIPDASSSVAQVLNNIGKDKKINDLTDFFDAEFEDITDKNAKEPKEKNKIKSLISDDNKENFIKYLDKTLPKS
jgi:hypothetical protein